MTRARGWALIAGQRDQGRIPAVQTVHSLLQNRGWDVRGFFEEPFSVEGEKKGWDLVRLGDGARTPVARPSPNPNLCGYEFRADLFGEARDFLTPTPDCAILTAGKLEASKEGHWPAIEALMGETLVILMVRPHQLTKFMSELPDPVAALELPASVDDIQAFVEALVMTREASRNKS